MTNCNFGRFELGTVSAGRYYWKRDGKPMMSATYGNRAEAEKGLRAYICAELERRFMGL